ncbi:MAG: hypothetical protein DRJ65_11275 [Acidobacteria bacterium]|nr:MAG: hypothetical protein DRJ65_11275 [Acidobacteriota bacterium]
MTIERQSVIRSILKGWPWILGAVVVAATVIAVSWMATPEIFRTSVELHIILPDTPDLWGDTKELKGAIASEGRRVISVVMSGEVKEAVGQSMGARYGLDLAASEWRKVWSEDWRSRVMAAGPVDGEIFLIVDDEDGERGVALAQAVLEALEVEWRRRREDLRKEVLVRLNELIDQGMARLGDLASQTSGTDRDLAQGLALAAERDHTARTVGALRLRRSRLEISGLDDPLPWLVVGKPMPFEHHIQRKPRMAIILSALAFVLLVAVAWVAWDKG